MGETGKYEKSRVEVQSCFFSYLAVVFFVRGEGVLERILF